MSTAALFRIAAAGLGVGLQSTLLLAVGLWAGFLLRRRGPAMRVLVYRATLAVVVVGALVSLGGSGRHSTVLRVGLPGAEDGGLYLGRPPFSALARRAAPAP